jgi:hypothetical protein
MPCLVNHAYSNHAKGLNIWRYGRDEVHEKIDKHQPKMFKVHTNRDFSKMYKWPLPGTGTSTLNAVYLAILLAYKDILVCGVPMDNGPHYYDPPWHVTNFTTKNNVRPWWKARNVLKQCGVTIISENLNKLIFEFKDV